MEHSILTELKPICLEADNVALGKAWHCLGISSPFNRLYYITSGTARIELADKTLELKPGYFYLVPSFTRANYICTKSMSKLYLHLQLQVLPGINLFDLHPCPHEIKVENPKSIEKLFAQIITLHQSNTPTEILQKNAAIFELLSTLMNYTIDTKASLNDAALDFAPVLSHIDRHLSEVLTLDDLAAIMDWHPTYFSNQFKAQFGRTPITFINEQRIEKAQQLLVWTEQTIKQITAQTGFADVYYFSRVFKQYTTQPPAKYRQLERAMMNS